MNKVLFGLAGLALSKLINLKTGGGSGSLSVAEVGDIIHAKFHYEGTKERKILSRNGSCIGVSCAYNLNEFFETWTIEEAERSGWTLKRLNPFPKSMLYGLGCRDVRRR